MSFYVIDVESDGRYLVAIRWSALGQSGWITNCKLPFMEKRALSVKNTMEKRLQ